MIHPSDGLDSYNTLSELDYGLGRAKQPVLIKRPQLYFMLALVGLDIGSTFLAYFFAHSLLLRQLPSGQLGPYNEFILLPLVHSVVLVAIFFSQKMYQRRRPVTHLDEFFKAIVYNSFAMLFTIAFMTLSAPEFNYHRSLVVYAWGFNVAILTIARTVHAQLQWQAQARGIGDDRVLVVGAGEIGNMLVQKIVGSPKLGYQAVGIIDEEGYQKVDSVLNVPILGRLVDIPQVIDAYQIDEVIVGLPESHSQDLVRIIGLCEREKVGIRIFPDVFQIMATEVSIGDLSGLPLLTVRDVALQGWKLTLKRVVDVILSAIFLILLSPIMLILAMLVKLDSPGPVFFIQERMGLDARPFRIIKFRSMREDAEESGPGWTVPGDLRNTKLGSIMRRLNLDELPQLINVIVGDMSLVGPRPERPVYVEQFRQAIPRYMDRHREKAGLTGWAQVNGLRGDTSIAERTKYDLWYIENWSLALDFKIIIRTIIQTILGTNRNAY
ncbi:MAG: undecaprenyl-phosphate glucose phosphotransferase [Chloroflexota bacterium]